jgi:hypothetical protein
MFRSSECTRSVKIIQICIRLLLSSFACFRTLKQPTYIYVKEKGQWRINQFLFNWRRRLLLYISDTEMFLFHSFNSKQKFLPAHEQRKLRSKHMEIFYIYYSKNSWCILMSLPCHLFMTVINKLCYQKVWPDKSRHPETVWINPQRRSPCSGLEMSVHWVCKYDDDKLPN